MARPRLGRYSRAVRIFRVGLPLVALGLMSSIFLVSREDFAGGFRFSAADFAVLRQGLRLAHPRFTGTTEKGEPYLVSADWALPDAPDPKVVTLSAVRAEIVTEDGRTLSLTAAEGRLHPREQRVALSGRIVLTTSDGYKAETATATADIGARTLDVPGAVRAEGPLGRIEAGAMRMVRPDRAKGGGDEIVVFENRVRVVYVPQAAPRPGPAGEKR